MYGQKVVRKGVQKAPRNPKSPVKQANPSPRKVQKRVKNGPQKRHQKCTQKSSLKSTRNRPKIGVQSKYYKRPPLQKPVHRKHALKTLGRWFTHPHFKLHACQHLKSRKVHKPVKWDPTKGPLGAKSAKKGTKTAIGMKEE
jgi:hypothetical protein